MNKISDIHNVQSKAAAINARIKQVRAGVKNPVTAQHGDDIDGS